VQKIRSGEEIQISIQKTDYMINACNYRQLEAIAKRDEIVNATTDTSNKWTGG
jgi:hypothetical protein